ncbi:hypothetical protein CTEN210_01530 [Chaetoceros tenuissimus]|uniref:Nucleoid-associated protein n=1 Tax=Chaetoceros tenuissimus TaxID=426638 RepID=A0AAD3CFV2_9STRA|nr:hypothetical protein CTEN210_01530 [Chaetoceros tenuissimus]
MIVFRGSHFLYLLIALDAVHGFMPNQVPIDLMRQHSISSSSTKLNFLWFGNDEKKTKSEEKVKKGNKDNKSQMGRTATTMENFKQTQELGKKTGNLLNDLSLSTVEGSGAKGKIKIAMDGQQRPKLVEIEEEYFNEVTLEDFTEALTLAMQDAHDKSTKMMEDKMAGLYTELGLPQRKE